MPLQPGKSQAVIAANVAELIKAGHGREQAIAIAEKQARGSKDSAGRFRFYATERLGPNQRETPEGFLICENVPIARTGSQLYAPDEVPVDDGGLGRVSIKREEAEVFRAETMASFEGKPVTIDHPDDFVNPDNWKQLSVGITQNVRRGEGLDNDLMIADLLITDREGIKLVRGGLRQVSCGYDAEYGETAPGIGYQHNIVGNHVALVERGRAGPRCSIGDKEANIMAGKSTVSMKDRWKKMMDEMFSEEMTDEEMEQKKKDDDEAQKKATGDSIAKLTATVDSLAKIVGKMIKDSEEEEKKTDTEDGDDEEEAKKNKAETGDIIITAEPAGKADNGKTWTGDTLSRAEILCPGVKAPTFDSKDATGSVVALQRKALQGAMETTDGALVVTPFLGGRDLKTLTGDALHSVFVGASELMRHSNNSQGQRQSVKTGDVRASDTISKMNKANQEFWAKHGNK